MPRAAAALPKRGDPLRPRHVERRADAMARAVRGPCRPPRARRANASTAQPGVPSGHTAVDREALQHARVRPTTRAGAAPPAATSHTCVVRVTSVVPSSYWPPESSSVVPPSAPSATSALVAGVAE